MHVNRIYGGALLGGVAAGALIGVGTCLIIAVVASIQNDGVNFATIIGGIGIGLLGAVYGAFFGLLLGLAVGVGTSLMGALVTGVVRLLGERVSGPMMIVAGGVGTVPVMAWLTFWLRDIVYYRPGLSLLLAFGAIAVVAAAAAVCLDWLFDPKRRFDAPVTVDPTRVGEASTGQIPEK